MFKLLFVCTIAAVGAVLLAGPAIAADEDKTHDGFVVSVEGDKLAMADDKEGKENPHTHVIGADAKITLNGEASELVNLQKGDAIKVTTDKDGKVLAVAATRDKA